MTTSTAPDLAFPKSAFSENLLRDAYNANLALFEAHWQEHASGVVVPLTPEEFLQFIESFVEHEIGAGRSEDPGDEIDQLASYLFTFVKLSKREWKTEVEHKLAIGIAGDVASMDAVLMYTREDIDQLEDYIEHGVDAEGEAMQLVAAKVTLEYLTEARLECQLAFLDAGYEALLRVTRS